ncbi:HIT family protein [Pediococcus cellicola]|uniref:Cell-cycle regulation histidine triad protein n=1 Tax=Pediococcus cellicola TaxID=319652 RepID=A0A0R2J0F0_9LACO|nr:HIT family protein [Pediococcus cellicola]KRN67767.1 cell-cycle regulation histidine triad protein [Pediococcus cellicola]GEL14239.1 histidine triad protein [Pediococcus cellicola]
MMNKLDASCIFCKIITGEIPSYTIYEDDNIKAFLDLSQATPGHTLVVPKTHIKDIFAYDADLAAKTFAKIPLIASAIKTSNPKIVGMNIVNNNGTVAYQSVFHSHFHLIPRYSENDDFKMIFGDNSKAYTEAQLASIQSTIQAELRN